MTDWLYGKGGYYSSYKEIGKRGDFFTSVSASKFFGGTIGKHIVSLIEKGEMSPNTSICEIGAHHGYLLSDIIEFIYTLKPELLQSLEFVIIEKHQFLRDHQIRYFEESFGDAVKLVQYDSMRAFKRDEVFFIANEIFDAFPCELYFKGNSARVEEHKVHFDVKDEKTENLAKKYHKDRGEIAVGYEEFAQEMSACAPKFEFMTYDYGEKTARPDFSIRIYEDHEVHPFFSDEIKISELFSNHDITYDVTFNHVIDAFSEVGVKEVEFSTQMKALIEMGILDLLEMLQGKVEEKLYKQELDKAKYLIMPDQLGERFKMLRLRQGF